MELSLLLEGRRHLSDQLYHGVRRAILDGRLGVKERMPGSRELARQLNVSRNTVLAAYGRLISEGYLNSSIGSGTYVAPHFPNREQRLRRAPTKGSVRLSAFGNRLTPPQAIVPRRDLTVRLSPGCARPANVSHGGVATRFRTTVETPIRLDRLLRRRSRHRGVALCDCSPLQPHARFALHR